VGRRRVYRDLAECLFARLQAKEELTALCRMLRHLDLVAESPNRWPNCALFPGTNEADGATVAAAEPQARLGLWRRSRANDLVIRAVTNGQPGNQFSVELNPDTLPNVLVDINSYQQVKDRARNKEDMRYLEECLQSANWLTKAMRQRAVAIMKVVSEIVRQQEAFLQHGLAYLKPMTLKDVAGD
jgi:RNA polymerase sigma-54 factor